MRLNGMSMDAVNPTAPPAAATAPPAPTRTLPSPQPVSSTSPLNASLPDDLDTLKRMVRELLELLKTEKHRSDGLQHRLDQLLRRLYGPKGEKFRPDQPGLFELLNEVAAAQAEEPAPPQPTVPPPTEAVAAQPKKKGHGRRSLPEDLRRERIVYDVPAAEKVCSCCQTPRIKIGEETSEQLDYQPAKLFIWEHVRLKCRQWSRRQQRLLLNQQCRQRSKPQHRLLLNQQHKQCRQRSKRQRQLLLNRQLR